ESVQRCSTDGPLGGLPEYHSSPACDARSLGRTQGASISVDMGATEDAARGEQRGPAAQTVFRQALLHEVRLTTTRYSMDAAICHWAAARLARLRGCRVGLSLARGPASAYDG